MFGKKDKEWEYVEQYFQEDNYGQVADEEYWRKERSSTGYLTEMFKPHLKNGEQILCVIGSGNDEGDNSKENPKRSKATNGIIIARNILIAMFAIGIIICLLFNGKVGGIGFLMTLPYFLCSLSLPLLIVVIVIVASMRGTKAAKNANYAITDKRILIMQSKQLTQVSLKIVTNTSVHINSDNSGKIIVNACRDLGKPTNYTYVLYKVNDPYRVKAILDDAVQKCKMNLNQG